MRPSRLSGLSSSLAASGVRGSFSRDTSGDRSTERSARATDDALGRDVHVEFVPHRAGDRLFGFCNRRLDEYGVWQLGVERCTAVTLPDQQMHSFVLLAQ